MQKHITAFSFLDAKIYLLCKCTKNNLNNSNFMLTFTNYAI